MTDHLLNHRSKIEAAFGRKRLIDGCFLKLPNAHPVVVCLLVEIGR